MNDVDSVPPIISCKIIDNHGRPDGFPADGSDHGFPGRDGQGDSHHHASRTSPTTSLQRLATH